MPEDNKSGRERGKSQDSFNTRAHDKTVEIIFIILIIMLLFSTFSAFFSSRPFKALLGQSSEAGVFEDVDTPVGGEILLKEASSVYVTPGGEVAGVQPKGAKGTVVGGPEYFNGERYWYVDFESGPDGWVAESALEDVTGADFDPGDTPIGSQVSLGGEEEGTPVFSEPGGEQIGTQPDGTSGTITKGPIYANGERYWYVDYESGPDGWVAESSLGGESAGLLSGIDTPIGSTAQTGKSTSVLGIPGGSSIGNQPEGAKGTVTKGPEYVDGKKYWYVDFESGPDGWVAEDALLSGTGGAFDSGDSPVGSETVSPNGSKVLASPGGKQIGTQPAGAKGVVAKGPEYVDGERYWYVDFESGPDGWVAESSLRDKNGGPFDPGSSLVGSKTEAKGGIPVFLTPGGEIIGVQPKTAKGIVTKGPEYKDGERYWYVDFESGPDGWVKEDSLRNAKGGKFDPGSTPVGETAYAISEVTDVFGSPGGQRIGSQPRGAKGVITKGPLAYGGERYWYVDFESGPDGWVKESDLFLPAKETLFSKLVSGIYFLYKIIVAILATLFLTGIVYSLVRTSQIVAERNRQMKMDERPREVHDIHKEHVNQRWEKVLVHIQSENPTDWRLAVLEADIMLSEILDRMGYVGENVGEKLKSVEKSDFDTIDDAWEAHKVRNMIAHEGSDYVLSQREAQRVISMYARVFKEFRYI